VIEGKLIGYARTSREDQNLGMQLSAMKKEGVDEKNIFQEKVSALAKKRPQFDLALKRCRKGDVLVVWKLDRLGRSVTQLINTVNDLKDRGVGFKSLTESFDTSTPMGTLIFNIMAALAQMERDTTSERTVAGLVEAKEKGTYTTRKLTFTRKQWNAAVDAYKESDEAGYPLNRTQIAKVSGIKYSIISRAKNWEDIKSGMDFDTRFPYEKNRKANREKK
jgi:DNA invertase Pin-like site-specific DNA recombinase